MVLKTFLSKKNTRIYFFIVLLISVLCSFVSWLNNYYIKTNNKNFKDCYIYITGITEAELKQNKYIKLLKYEEKENNGEKEYYITLKDWSYLNRISNTFENGNHQIEIIGLSNYNEHLVIIIKLCRFLVVVIKVIVVIMYAFIIIDLIIDGTKKYKLFYTLGATKLFLLRLIILECLIFILEFIIISSFLSLIGNFIIYN